MENNEKYQETSTGRKKTTLGELGPNLPIGLVGPDGKLHKGLAHDEWDTRRERQMGKSKKKNLNQAEHVSLILTNLYRRVGSEAWDPASVDEKQRRLQYGGRLSQMYSGDVFYMYYWLRKQVIGDVIEIEKMTCQMCGAEFPWEGDLNTVEVTTVDRPEDMDWEYELTRPFKFQDQEAKVFTLRSPLWGAFERQAGSITSENEGRVMAVYSSIVAVNGKPAMASVEDVDDLSKRDLERIAARLDKNYVGPRMAIEQDCPKCERTLAAAIDWRHESFFSSSSR